MLVNPSTARALALAVLGAGAATPAVGEPHRYVVRSEASTITVHVGRSGLLKFAGHEHEVISSEVEGEVVADPDDLGASSVRLRVPTAGLRVSGKGEPAKDVPKVQARMESADVLDIARFPEVTFTSRSVTGRRVAPGTYSLTLGGDLTLHGVTRAVELPLDVALDADTLSASGRLRLRQTQYGMEPVSVAGVVNVKDEVAVDFRIVARVRTGE